MRKYGPFRSIRLCAWIAVGAISGPEAAVGAWDDVPVKVVESSLGLATLTDRRYQTAGTSKRMRLPTTITTRARIEIHFTGRCARARRGHSLIESPVCFNLKPSF